MENVNDLVQKANSLLLKGEYPEARKIFDQILTYDSENIAALIGKCVSRIRDHDEPLGYELDKAFVFYRKAVILSNRKTSILLDFGDVLNESGAVRFFEEAVIIFNEVLERESDNLRALKGKVYSLYRLSKFDECTKVSSEALKLKIDNPKVWFYCGWSYMNLDKYSQALDCYNNVVKYDTKDDVAWCYRALCLNKLHLFEDAIKSADQALLINPTYSTAYLYKHDALISLGRKKEAAEVLKQMPYEPIDNM